MHTTVPAPEAAVTLLQRVPLFTSVSASDLHDLADEAKWLCLSTGDVLCRRGDPSDHVWVLLLGRLEVEVNSNLDTPLGSMNVGECIGEMGVLTQAPRSAEIRAVRESLLLELTRDQFLDLSREHPALLLSVTTRLGNRLRDRTEPKHPTLPRVLAVVAGCEGAPLQRFGRSLATHMPDSSIITRSDALRGLSSTEDEKGLRDLHQVGHWLADLEQRHEYIILLADQETSPWTRICLKFADLLLVVADAHARLSLPDPNLRTPDNSQLRRVELVLIHPRGTKMPSGTRRWLDALPVDAHHHVRLDENNDLERVSRRLLGRSVAVVFGGGAARGVAHLGALRAFDELGIPIDMTCGTSMGAVVGGVCALGRSAEEVSAAVEPFFSNYGLLRPRVLPLVSLLDGLRIDHMCNALFGDAHVEDTWVRFFSVASNLGQARPEVMDTGPLAFAVRASGSVPCIWPPVRHGDHVLVDGVITNNLPGDLAIERQRGLTVAINVIPREDPLFAAKAVPRSGTRLLMQRLNPFEKARQPMIIDIGLRSLFMATVRHAEAIRQKVDLFIEPDVGHFGFVLERTRRAQIAEVGYRAAIDALTSWMEREPRVPRR